MLLDLKQHIRRARLHKRPDSSRARAAGQAGMDKWSFGHYHRGRYLRIMSERENLGAGIYAALSALVVLLCLIGAFVLPPSFVASKWLGGFALVGLLIGIPVLLRLAHRSRIRDAVGTMGGTVVRIKRLSFWQQPITGKYAFFLGVRYAVEYVDLLGITRRALCNSGFFQGVEWLEDAVIDGP